MFILTVEPVAFCYTEKCEYSDRGARMQKPPTHIHIQKACLTGELLPFFLSEPKAGNNVGTSFLEALPVHAVAEPALWKIYGAVARSRGVLRAGFGSAPQLFRLQNYFRQKENR